MMGGEPVHRTAGFLPVRTSSVSPYFCSAIYTVFLGVRGSFLVIPVGRWSEDGKWHGMGDVSQQAPLSTASVMVTLQGSSFPNEFIGGFPNSP